MRYFRLEYDDITPNDNIFCNKSDIGSMDPYILNQGNLILSWNVPTFLFNPLKGNTMPDYLFTPHSWLIVSDRFMQVTEPRLRNEVQFLPVRVINSFTHQEHLNYFAVNIIGLIDALDWSHAEYERFDEENPDFIFVSKYALQESNIGQRSILRLKCNPFPVFVSEELKLAIEQAHLNGFLFQEVAVFP